MNIAPAEAAKPVAPPVPTRKVAPAPKPAPKPAAKAPAMEEVQGSGKKRSGPSMKERLLAEREAAAQAQKAPAKPAAKPARRSSATKETAGRPTRERKSGSTRGSARAGADSARPSKARASKARGSKKRGKEVDEIVVSEESTVRGRHSAKRKGALLPLMSIAAVLLAGVGVFLFMQQEKNSGAVDAADQNTDTEVADANAGENATDAAGEGGKEMADPAAEETTPDAVEPDAAEETADPEPEPEMPKKEMVKKGPDPDSVDLTAIEDFGPVDGMSEEDFADLTAKANLMVDPEAGAAGNRAKKALIEAERLAFPALINKFKTLDFTTVQGYRDGDLIQASLREICGGMSLGWKFSTEPADVYYNKKAVKGWADNWRVAQSDPVRWDAMTKKKKKVEEEPASELGEDSMDDLDELDDF